MRIVAIVVALAVSVGVGPAAGQAGGRAYAPGVATELRVVTYEVTGSTAEELHASMRSRGPAEGGRRWFGYTKWNVRWSFRYAPDAAGCGMSRVAVDFRSEITMPEWDPPTGADPGLVAAWRDFTRALETHEEGHRDIGLEAAREIRRSLRSLRRTGCHGIEQEANAVARRILDRFRERERQYDRSTGSGSGQGAMWPPSRMRPGGPL